MPTNGLIGVILFNKEPIVILRITTVRVVQLLTAVRLCAFCWLSSNSMAEQIELSRSILLFDAGPVGSSLEPGALQLNPKCIYTPKVGFGWTHSPQEQFNRRELSKSRNAMTIDGVSGPRLEFRADIAPGKWFLSLWVEAGIEDTSTLELRIQGRKRALPWQRFRSPPEPRQSLHKTYRVFQGIATVGSEGISIKLIGGHDKVRLLGLSLIQHVEPSTAGHSQFVEKLTLAGRYKSPDSLTDLRKQVEDVLDQDPSNAYYAHWLERLELLDLAERYFSMRGWEWATEKAGLGMFDRLYQAVMLVDGLLSLDSEQECPLTERALFLRGRILYWLDKQMGGTAERANGQRDLEKLYTNHPHDQLLAMYVGKDIDLPDPCDCLESSSNAPDWSVAQREALCRLRQIAHWWVNVQQAGNGEFGGKLGDDVELLRWWTPLVLSGDKTAQRGWEKLAKCVWQSEHIHHGYARKLADVEHAAEFVADTMCVPTLFSDDSSYLDGLTYSAEHFEKVWTGDTTGGHRHFRSAWFSSTAVDVEEPKGRDLEYNTRAVKAIRYLTYRRPDPKVIRLLHEWSLAWVSAALRTDKGKPRGIIPASVRFTDEALNGDEPNWYRANMLWSYYEWEHYGGSMMLDQLLFTYMLTKDERLLQPMFLALELIRSEQSKTSSNGATLPEEGSRLWAAQTLVNQKPFWNVVEQWRFFTGDSRWDDLILQHGTHYGRYRLSRDESHLVDGLNHLLENVRYNTPLKTSEAIHTDRVYAPGSDHLKAMLTGDGVQEDLSPYFAVTWEQTGEDFTALVNETGQDTLRVKLYSHSAESDRIVMRLWQLAPGKYVLRQETQGHEAKERPVTVQQRGERIPLDLPSRRLLNICIERSR